MSGTLYLVATPIGNLEDITFRAVRILREEVQLIACEDTRQTQKLLAHYGIRKPMISYHEHNEMERVPDIINSLVRGENVALVSDAGTPLLSDPGYRIVTAAIEKALRVVPLPGASAILTALAASGLATDEFWFLGFLPYKASARRKLLSQISECPGTVIAYESPHRILETLADVAQILGARPIVLARELTKIYEEFLRGTAAEIRGHLIQNQSVRGEMTLLIGKSEQRETDLDADAEIARLQHEGMSRMEAIKAVAKRLGLPKRELYRLAAGQPGGACSTQVRDRQASARALPGDDSGEGQGSNPPDTDRD